MKTFCDYHPTRPAQWHCPDCEIAYCGECITNRVVNQYGKKKAFHFCPKCDSEVERLAVGAAITPFWSKLPKFFAYPFHLQPFILMAVLAIATALFSKPTVFSALMRVAIWGIILKYSFAVLQPSSKG